MPNLLTFGLQRQRHHEPAFNSFPGLRERWRNSPVVSGGHQVQQGQQGDNRVKGGRSRLLPRGTRCMTRKVEPPVKVDGGGLPLSWAPRTGCWGTVDGKGGAW
jgi:hypothetical protein